MSVAKRDIVAIQRYYPQIYLACHTHHQRRRTNNAQLTANESTLLAHLTPQTPTRAATLARHLGIGPSSVSAAIKRLIRLGYIVRTVDAQDKRAASLLLSAQGVRAMQASSVLDSKRVAAVLSRLSADERARAIAGLRLLAEASLRSRS